MILFGLHPVKDICLAEAIKDVDAKLWRFGALFLNSQQHFSYSPKFGGYTTLDAEWAIG